MKIPSCLGAQGTDDICEIITNQANNFAGYIPQSAFIERTTSAPKTLVKRSLRSKRNLRSKEAREW
jgi:hypothetical protein